MEERIDEVQELYDKCDNIATISNALFIINVLLSFILLFSFKYREIIVISSLILTIIYVTLVNINEMYFSNVAENERRKSLLKESFNINTTIKETNKYYNNSENPSINKLGLNCYESLFFTKKIVDKMIPTEILKTCFLLIIYIILMIKIENLDVLLIITQTLFSAEIIFSFIKLIYYKIQLDKIDKEFENIFFVAGLNSKKSKTFIIDTTMDYECLKSYCKISISSKLFRKYNIQWSKEWDKLYQKIKKYNSQK